MNRTWKRTIQFIVHRSSFILLYLSICLVAHGQIDIPAAINYQGRLTKPTDGTPVQSGAYMVEFRIWGHPTSTETSYAIWGRSYPVHVVTNGIFNVLLSNDGGELTNPVPETNDLLEAFQAPDRYLGLKVTHGPDGAIDASELRPRQRLVSAPYTIHSQHASKFGGKYAEEYYDLSMFRDLDLSSNYSTLVGWKSDGMVYKTPLVNYAGKVFIGASPAEPGSGVALKVGEGIFQAQNAQIEGDLEVAGNLTVDEPSTLAGYGTIPIGGIILWSGAAGEIPSGWALCDGASGTPDLRNRFIVGAGGEYGVGDAGGDKTVTLTEDQMPSHSHAYTRYANDKGYYATHHDNQGYWQDTETHSTGKTGGNQPHENRPPYYALCYIMRVK